MVTTTVWSGEAATAVAPDKRASKRRDPELLDAAARVFARSGYADSSLQAVADELGIVKGSLNDYIDSKEELLLRLLAETEDGLLHSIHALAPGGDPLVRLREYVHRQVEFHLRHAERVAVYHREAPRRESGPAGFRDAHDRLVSGLVRRAQRDGTMDAAVDAGVAAGCVLGIVSSADAWHAAGRRDAEEVPALCAEFAIRGLASVRSRPSEGSRS